jgi:hypothetical protein
MKGKVHISIVLVVSIVLVIAGGASASSSDEIPWAGPTSLPDYIGAPAKAHPTANSGVPQDPFLAPNAFAHAHKDIWMSDTGDVAGPLGRNPVTLSTTLPKTHDNSWLTPCGSYAFDSHGRLIVNCWGGDEASVVMVDPDTLEVLTHYDLTVQTGDPFGEGAQKILPSFYSVYGYLDERDQIHIVSGSREIVTIGEAGSPSSPVFEKVDEESYDLGELIKPTEERPEGDSINGVIMDFQGRYWINMRQSARIFLLNPATVKSHDVDKLPFVDLGAEEFTRNGLALTKEGAAYIVTTQAMYRVDAGSDDQPRIVWRQPYDTVPANTNNEEYVNGVSSGQLERGSGTTPTILGEGKYVAITDNAPQMNVVVYRTDAQLDPNEERVVCKVPVFDFPGGGKGANSNSLVGSRNSIIVQNTTDYLWDWAEYDNAHLEHPGKPGIERIDIDPNGKGCTKVWVNTEVAAVMTLELSTRTGLIYTQDRKYDAENNVNAYYFVALDFRTGEVVWEKLMGTGDKFDNWWLPVAIGPNGALYGMVYGGITMMRDTR